jgi:hypothetical protein
MHLPKSEVLDILRDRRTEPEVLDAASLLPDCVDTERDCRALERLGLARGDLLKHYGGANGIVIVRRRCRPAEESVPKCGGGLAAGQRGWVHDKAVDVELA